MVTFRVSEEGKFSIRIHQLGHGGSVVIGSVLTSLHGWSTVEKKTRLFWSRVLTEPCEWKLFCNADAMVEWMSIHRESVELFVTFESPWSSQITNNTFPSSNNMISYVCVTWSLYQGVGWWGLIEGRILEDKFYKSIAMMRGKSPHSG